MHFGDRLSQSQADLPSLLKDVDLIPVDINEEIFFKSLPYEKNKVS